MQHYAGFWQIQSQILALTQSNGRTESRRDLLNKSAREDDNSAAPSFNKRAQIRSGPQALFTSNVLSRSKTSEEVVWIESRIMLEIRYI